MHVVFVTPSSQGGMVHYASQLANAMVNRAEVTQLLPEGASCEFFSDEICLRNIPIPVAKEQIGLKTPRDLYRTYKRIIEPDADIIHFTTEHQLFPLFLPGLRRRNYVLTCHDVNPHKGEFSLSAEVAQHLLVSNATKVVVHGNYNADQFENKYGDQKKCVGIRHGDYAMFNHYCDDPISYQNQLLFFGRIRPYKGLKTLMRAERILSNELEDYRVIVAGNGDLGEAERKWIERSENVIGMNEYIPDAKVCELFSHCRAVVLPYTDATQSGIIPIAYSFHKPVIASAVGAIPEIVEHNRTGLLIDPNDPQQLADSCVELITDKQFAKQLGDAGFRFSKEHMDWDKIANELLSMYEAIV